jgi:hypothetical protein
MVGESKRIGNEMKKATHCAALVASPRIELGSNV